MFDDYPSPPSTPSSSSRLRAIPHLPSCPHATRRASKASDMAQLLDPSYSPTRTNNQIYVDHAGEAHDPDFRLFAPAGYSPKRRAFMTCDSDLPARDGDRARDAHHSDDDAASFTFSFSYSSPKRSSFDSASSSSSRHYRPDSRASDPVYSRTSADPAYATFAYTFDEQGYLSDDEPRREANKLRRRRGASLEHDRPLEHPESSSASPAEPQPPRADRTACTTSASTIRRQWHALRLRTQVAAFHARKRVTRIVSPTG